MSESPPPPPPAISLSDLFFGFARISLTGFGMVLPWARWLIVDKKRWLTAEQFNETFTLAQFVPGPNVVNMSVVFGSRIRGAAGAACALAGLLGPPTLIATFLAYLYSVYGDIELLRRVLAGIAAAAIGLMIAVIAKMAQPLLHRLSPAPLAFAATFIAVGVMRLPLVWTLVVIAPLSVAAAYWWQRK